MVKLKFNDYPSLLEEIRKRPQMYLGGKERNIELLGAYLDGFATAEWFHEIPPDKHMANFNWEGFEEWVKNTYNKSHLSLNSMPLALHICNSKSGAFDLWYSWYDLYSQGKNVKNA